MTYNKLKDNIWNIEKIINKADIVIGVGRSLYDAMACGRAVISYDTRYKDRNFEGDGYLDKTNIYESLEFNCCGGANRLFFTQEGFIGELQKYNADDGNYMREFAVKELNISKSVESYIAVYNRNSNMLTKDPMAANYYNEMNAVILRLMSTKSWRVTEPFRKIYRIIRKIVRFLRYSSSI
jgi:hypothetical protein